MFRLRKLLSAVAATAVIASMGAGMGTQAALADPGNDPVVTVDATPEDPAGQSHDGTENPADEGTTEEVDAQSAPEAEPAGEAIEVSSDLANVNDVNDDAAADEAEALEVAPLEINRDALRGAAPLDPRSLVPLPVNVQWTDGKMEIDADTSIVISDESLRNVAEMMAITMRASTGFALPIEVGAAKDGALNLVVGDVPGYPNNTSAYGLTVTEARATITASDPQGAFYGTQTLLQMLPPLIHSDIAVNGAWELRTGQITDAPRYEYRGIMVDVARSFLEKEELLKLIDQYAHFKMSYVHLHLSDDQGWRIEITNEGRAEGDTIDYTRLTSVSGEVAMHYEANKSLQASNELGRIGYYTQDDYKEIVKYAADRFITIVPEIDVPGHTTAALHAIPELNTAGSMHEGTPEQPTQPHQDTGDVGRSYLDPDSEATYTFVHHVFKQLAEMSPGPYIHIGGDEPHAFINRYDHDKFNETLKRLVDIVHQVGKKAIGWNEVAAADLSAGDTVQHWIGKPDATKQAITNRGAKAILSRSDRAYLDQKYNNKSPIGLVWACKGSCDFDKYYDWNPTDFLGMGTDEPIRGVEAPQWSETVRGGDQAEYLQFPRVISYAEIGWTPQEKRNKADFVTRMAEIGPRLTANNTNFYDGDKTAWDYDIAGHNTSGKAGEATDFPIGLAVAPGTVLEGTALSPDTVNDIDGVSRSTLAANSVATIAWGDGSTSEVSSVKTAKVRTEYGAPRTYHLTGTHTYAEAGTYHGTVTLGEKSAPFTITITDDGTAPAPTLVIPNVEGPASISPASLVTKAGEEIQFEAAGFQFDQYADVRLEGNPNYEIRPGADGTRRFPITAPTAAGIYPLTITQTDPITGETRTVTAQVIVLGDAELPYPLDHTDLEVAAFSSEATNEERPNGRANAAIDGNPDTFWHTKWADPAAEFPHFIDLKLKGSQCKIYGIEYTPRKDNPNTRVKDYEIYVSDDGATWGDPVISGSLQANPVPQAVVFDQPVTGQYVKMKQLNSHNGDNFGGAAEIRVGALCDGAQPASITIPAEQVPSMTDEDLTIEAGQAGVETLVADPDTSYTWTLSDYPEGKTLMVGPDNTVLGSDQDVEGTHSLVFSIPASVLDNATEVNEDNHKYIDVPVSVIANGMVTTDLVIRVTSPFEDVDPLTPTLTLDPVDHTLELGQVYVGGDIFGDAQGFATQQKVIYELQDGEGTLIAALGENIAGADGRAITQLTILESVEPGEYVVVAYQEKPDPANGEEVSASAPLTVLAEPEPDPTEPALTVNPAEGYVGDEIVLEATGFAAGEDVTFELHSDPVNLGSAVANAEGVATLTTTVPAGTTPGAHTVWAKQDKVGASAPLTVLDKGTVPDPKPDPKPDPAPQPDPGKPGTPDTPDKPGIPGKPGKPGKPGPGMPATGSQAGIVGLAALALTGAGLALVRRRKADA